MKFEVRCTACGKGYLVDETKIPVEGGFVPCQSCGTTIRLTPRIKTAAAAPSAASTAAPAVAPPAVSPAGPTDEVCCPRCGLHFVPPLARADRPPSARPVVLIVEDMDYFVEIARDALGGRYELKATGSIEDARALLSRGGIDLLLLDLTLEGGQDGLRLLRESPKVCPILLFTAQDESEMYGEGWTRLMELGIDDVVMKGMNMGEILARKVSALLGEPQPNDSYQR